MDIQGLGGELGDMNDHVLVFAPAPQLTVTVEQPADTVEIMYTPGARASGRPA
jgi:hypothetical protein